MKVLFLDRDGVINRYPGHKKYVTGWKSFRFLPRAKMALRLLHKNRFRVFVVSNQAGVSKGLYTRKELDLLTRNMLKEVSGSGGKISKVYYCTHSQDERCSCRKPKPGLIRKAKKEFGLKTAGAYFVGDSILDVKTAKACRLKSILVLSGRERLKDKNSWELQPDVICKDILEAALFLTRADR